MQKNIIGDVHYVYIHIRKSILYELKVHKTMTNVRGKFKNRFFVQEK